MNEKNEKVPDIYSKIEISEYERLINFLENLDVFESDQSLKDFLLHECETLKYYASELTSQSSPNLRAIMLIKTLNKGLHGGGNPLRIFLNYLKSKKKIEVPDFEAVKSSSMS